MALQEKMEFQLVDNFTKGMMDIRGGINTADKALGNFSNTATKAFTNLAALGTAGSALNSIIDSTKSWALAVNDLQDKTGMAGETASQFLVLGQHVGLATEETGNAFAKMSRNVETARVAMANASASGKASTDVFTKWGISIKDSNGRMLSAEQIYQNVAERHRDMANGVSKTAMEMEIFGKSGAKLNDLLNLSKEQIKDVTDYAEKMGLVINGETSQAVEDLSFQTNKLKMGMEGLKIQIGQELIPQLVSLTEYAQQAITGLGQLDSQTKTNVVSVLEFVAAAGALGLGIQAVTFTFGPLISAGGKLIGVINGIATSLGIATSAASAIIAPLTVAIALLHQYNQDKALKEQYGDQIMSRDNEYSMLQVDQEKLAQARAVDANEADTFAYGTGSTKDVKTINEEAQAKAEKAAADEERMAANTATSSAAADKASKAAETAAKKAEEARKKLEELREKTGTMITDVAASLEGDIYGADGCTAYVADVLKKTNVAFGQVMSMDVGIAKQQAEEAGLYHEGTEGMKAGDVLVYGSNQYPTGSHVGIYDGVNGVYHNASSKGNKAYHQQGYYDMGAGTWVKGYIQTSGGAGASSEELKEAEKKYQQISGVAKAIISLNQGLDEKIANLTLSPAESQNVKLNNELADYQSTLEKAKKLGIDVNSETTKLQNYQVLQREKYTRESLISTHSNEMDMLSSRYRANEISNAELRVLQDQELQTYTAKLQEKLANEKLTEEDRLKLHQEYSQAIQQVEQNAAQTVKGAWDNTMKSMKNYTVDYQSSMTSVMGNIEDSFTGLMDGVVTGQNSFADNIKSSWDNIANSVINAVWKMAMQMMVVKPLFNWLGGIMGDSSVIDYSGGGLSLTGGMESYNYVGNDVISTSAMASGGIGTAGWHLVGEEGPEMVKFPTMGRVLNASDTSNALSGNSGSLENVRVEIVNKSGTDVKATDTSVKFDANGYIISVVLNAVSTNKNGMRDILKGAVSI